jgi:hypothetical protein
LLSTADGSESRQPLAAVLIGGSITSGLLSLIVTPVAYNMLEAISDRLKRLFRWLSGRPGIQPAPKPVPPTAAAAPTGASNPGHTKADGPGADSPAKVPGEA